jgi:hypothetical protein
VHHPIDKPEVVTASFRFIKESDSEAALSVDCYCHRQWMQTLDFQV